MRKVSNLENYIPYSTLNWWTLWLWSRSMLGCLHYWAIHRLVLWCWIRAIPFLNRATGPYWWAYWSMMTCNVFSPQFMWFKNYGPASCSPFHSIVVNIGMWFERLWLLWPHCCDYLTSSWTMLPIVDIGIFIGTIGFFFVLFLLYSRTSDCAGRVKSILKTWKYLQDVTSNQRRRRKTLCDAKGKKS